MEWKDQVSTGRMSTVIEGLTSVTEKSELRVVLHTGHQLIGVPLKCDHANGMFLFEIRTTPPAEIAWIPFSSVSYLHLVNPAGSLKGITGGKLTRDPSAPGVPSLELKRRAEKAFAGSVPTVEIQWSSTMTPAETSGIADFIEVFPGILTALKSDVMGKEALAGLQKILVKPTGDNLSAVATAGVLEISFPASSIDASVFNQKLLSTIEQAL
ncbi:MAG: hypothetical protein V4598_01255 [Bdellovibrionota bacterium]